ncbi:MAG: peptidoglycan editing factor PgeF [Cyclonatronaceae bacterium]
MKIKPLIWHNGQNLIVAFSQRQADLYPGDLIPGINLGLNTNEDAARVFEKREWFLNTLDIPVSSVAFARQVHSADVLYVKRPGTVDGADGFVTDQNGLALAIQVADCAAVFLADLAGGVIGAAHAGWKGAAGNIVLNTIAQMQAKGAKPDNMRAWISPCIGTARFEVGDEVAGQFPEEFVNRTGFKKPHVDLKGFIKSQLLISGLAGDRIYTDPGCTYDDSERFYSYRRQKERAGRMMGIIMLR